MEVKFLTNDEEKQACIANLSIRRVALKNHSPPGKTDFKKYIKPLDDVLNTMSAQQVLLERYQARFGELEEAEVHGKGM